MDLSKGLEDLIKVRGFRILFVSTKNNSDDKLKQKKMQHMGISMR